MENTSIKLSKDIIGKKISGLEYYVSIEKIKEFCLAINEQSAIYYSKEKAVEMGFKDIPVPITFPTSIFFWATQSFDSNFFTILAKLGIDPKRLLHYKQEYEYIQTLYVNTHLTIETEITDVKIGKMEMATMTSTYKDKLDQQVYLKDYSTIILRPE